MSNLPSPSALVLWSSVFDSFREIEHREPENQRRAFLKINSSFSFIKLLFLCVFFSVASAEDIATPRVTVPPLTLEHSEFAPVLARVVRSDGVRYDLLVNDSSQLDRYRRQLADAPLPTDKNEKIAHLINAYNAFTLALVVQELPRDKAKWNAWSIRDAGGWFTNVWKKYTFELAGTRVTLDQIEHAMLRPLGEPRIHFAVNCASVSCPPLMSKPFIAAQLDAQLREATLGFVNSTYHLRLVDGKIITNPILSWFGEDFAATGVQGFLASYMTNDNPLRERLIAKQRVTFFDYNWSLNNSTTP
jgi:Protein of unknown function, DUF547